LHSIFGYKLRSIEAENFSIVKNSHQGCGSGVSGKTLKKEAGSGSELGSI